MTVTIQIDEFSTGIRPQILPDGTWVSLGFTGQYMNATRDPIPLAVQRSIANKEFAVAESGDPEKPAMVGREIADASNANESWSVVAIASRGQDEKGRSTSFYRYFFCPGRGRIEAILAWIARYEKKNGHLPVFNPSETKHPGNSERFSFEPKTFPTTTLVNSPSKAVISLSSTRSYYDVHRWATEKANSQSQLIAWAFNAEALEKPWNFILIHTASDRAYAILGKAAANPPRVKTPVVADEQALKSAIKQLISSSEVKQTTLQTIENALKNEVPKAYWEDLLNSQGAINALNQKIYSPQMVRLMALRAIVMPTTLPETLVDWLKPEELLKNLNYNPTIHVLLELQTQLVSYWNDFPQIKNNCDTGFKLLERHPPPSGLFEKIGDYASKHFPHKNLSSFHYQLAAYFEQISKGHNGKISARIFEKAFPNELSSATFIPRNRSIVKDDIVKLPIVISCVIASLFLGFGGGFFWSEYLHSSDPTLDSSLPPSNPPTSPTVNPEFTSNPEAGQTDSPSESMLENLPAQGAEGTNDFSSDVNPIPANVYGEALEKFDSQTLPTIQNMVNDLEQELQGEGFIYLSDQLKNEIVYQLKLSLGNPDLNDELIVGKTNNLEPILDTDKQAWIQAIYTYQKQKKKLKNAGYILPGKTTIKVLKQEIKAKLKQPPPPSAP